MIPLTLFAIAGLFCTLAQRARRRYLRDMQEPTVPYVIARGPELTRLALYYGIERLAWRSWRTLWFWRYESDDSLRERCVRVLRGSFGRDTGNE